MGEVEISARAYVKMCLHAARYPHAAVNGLLLAPAPRTGECLCLTDCVPLFHSHLALSVMLEVALNQVDVWGAQGGLVVAGYYHANAALDDQRSRVCTSGTMLGTGVRKYNDDPGPLALKIAGRIAEFFPDAVLIMLDNQKLVPQPRVPPVIVLENHGLRWAPKDKNLVMWRDWEESRQMVGALLEGRAHQHLVDFDSHLDDIRQDWTNQQLNTQITQWIDPTNENA
ncbi:ER membrane protein complex subunit 9 isoform X1 [Loxodonta africana]|uniref:ER membrane protein complex subunit 9 isoform X1 n=1 Tax=Loxodonta africana TaxID=9785 RepID=UPI000C813844|nr:ER membrane protein complex subunit 9 isoform X1 [Loxodonta africana]XP_023395877.1 ER membrane protein complex subunit 9 isoform X1 [Loxodonta africana]XP_049754788.1 ER membrane protein complex subunit 9 isoform X1 [Elephas maximus indicus]